MALTGNKARLGLLLVVLLLLSACSDSGSSGQEGLSEESATLAEGERLRVLATTSIVGDVVAQVGGDVIELTVLMEPGQDPHAFEISAQDLARASGMHVIFVNGFDLEEGLIDALEGAAGDARIVSLSDGIEPIENIEHEEGEPAGDAHGDGETVDEHGHDGVDPHVWFDAGNVRIWSGNVERTLSELDPLNESRYETNAASFDDELQELDTFIRDSVERIPEQNRQLVTNHDTFSYFARAYGFEIVGTVIPGFTTGEEPSAATMAGLIELVRSTGTPALFIETTVNSDLARVISEETGAEVYELYTDALGPRGSGADSYTGMMRANMETLVEAFGQ